MSVSLRVTAHSSTDIQLSDSSDIVQFNMVALLCANRQAMYAHCYGSVRSAIHTITAY